GILTIPKFSLRHVNCALMMWDHHEHEVAIRIAGHLCVHHRPVHDDHSAHHRLVSVGARRSPHHRMHLLAIGCLRSNSLPRGPYSMYHRAKQYTNNESEADVD